MNRMEAFEADWAERHDMPVETFAQYRHADGSGYRLPGLSKNYRTWCNALDSVVIDLSAAEVTVHDGGAYLDACITQEIIETYGVKCK